MARTARNADIPSLGALDRAAGDLSRQLAQALREAVRRGDVHPGDALPSTRLLATSLQVARGTSSLLIAARAKLPPSLTNPGSSDWRVRIRKVSIFL